MIYSKVISILLESLAGFLFRFFRKPGFWTAHAPVFFGGVCLLTLSACTPGGLNLIRQLEARALKQKILSERDMCYFDFVKQSDFQECYTEASTRLIAEECVVIRRTEPIYQKDCEDFLYRIVMKPDSMFPGQEEEEEFRSASRVTDELNPDSPGEASRPGGCEEDSACKAKCRGFYTAAEDRAACYAYSVGAVNELEKVFEAFTDPTATKLNSVNLRYVRVALNINVADAFTDKVGSWDDSVTGVTQRDFFLKWMAEKRGTPSAAKVFRDADDFHNDGNHSLLTTMLGASGVDSTLSDRLSRSLTGATNEKDHNFIDRALVNNNGDILLWLHEFMVGDDSGNSHAVNIFATIYCAQHYTSRSDRRYLNHRFFLNLLDQVMEDERRADSPDDNDPTNDPPRWWTVNFGASNLVRSPDRWYHANDAVCWSRLGGPGTKPQ